MGRGRGRTDGWVVVSPGRELAGARLTTWLRGGLGGAVVPLGPRPVEPLVLYEFEACPFCRRVREAISALDLIVRVRPCPKGGTRFREEVEGRGGRLQFPFLVDPNTGDAMYESSEIVAHLFARYGRGPVPRSMRGGVLRTLALVASGLGRGVAGSRVRASRVPAEPLELHAFEASPAGRLVRERLCELELPYVLMSAAPGSARHRAGSLPRLIDPNPAGLELVGADPITRHLEQGYALGARP